MRFHLKIYIDIRIKCCLTQCYRSIYLIISEEMRNKLFNLQTENVLVNSKKIEILMGILLWVRQCFWLISDATNDKETIFKSFVFR